MDAAPPVLIVDLLAPERTALLELLRSLKGDRWALPTPCPGWSVKDIAFHVLGDDLGVLSRGRDSQDPRVEGGALPWDELVQGLNRLNQRWVEATRHMSPRVSIDLLELTGRWTNQYFSSLDPHALGDVVSWAGSGAAPNWLGIAREYTERWTHQQQIREAVGAPALMDPDFLRPVLATFMRSLPRTYEGVERPDGTVMEVQVHGDAGGAWNIVRQSGSWVLREGMTNEPRARAHLWAHDAWRLFTKALIPADAERAVRLEGDEDLARHLHRAVAIIA
jgi:uncharacterized protein (TIGR03083 family)